jgi:ATP-binding protein involved in chromosome partitioning
VLVTIPSEVSRGVVARSVAALSKGPNPMLGYVENMSGYYCRDCNAIKPLFSSVQPSTSLGTTRSQSEGQRSCEPVAFEIPCLGTVPFDPDLAQHCDQGIALEALRDTPVALALHQIAQRLLEAL